MSRIRPVKIGWLVAYLITMALVAAALLRLRWSVIAGFDNPEAVAQWRFWKEETERANLAAGPVSRRPVRSDVPPALVMMRDRFGAVLGVSLSAATLMFGFLGWALRGSFGSPRVRSDRATQ